MLNIKIREMDGCAREYRSETFMQRTLTCLAYKLDRRKSGHSRRKTRERRRRRCPISVFGNIRASKIGHISKRDGNNKHFGHVYKPYKSTDASDTFTNANEAKDLLDIECETRVIRLWRNRMIKLGLGIEDDADELLDRKGDTAAVPADKNDATRMEVVDYHMKRY
ncbi:hypothetical protein GJ496_008346 [Pomphorhynchus laevis]|nr:hypothetical protein GJ496_008346 [Pomphorhynchus laevis]